MHNLKDIRKDFTVFAKSLEKRSINLDIKSLQKLDEQNRQLIQQKETLEKEKKDISKSKDEKLFKKSKEISLDLEKISESQKKVKIELSDILSNIPNIPHPDVPDGKDENDNIEISKSSLSNFCCSIIFSKADEISLDLVNKDLSLDFEISFFSFSKFSFF